MLNRDKSGQYSKNRHSCFLLKYHLVVVTKYRYPVLTKEIEKRLNEITKHFFEEQWECKIISMKAGEKNHFHILFEATPTVQLSKLINNYKTVSSRLIRKEYADFLSDYYWKPHFWSRTYFVGCVSDVNEEIIKNYISNQDF